MSPAFSSIDERPSRAHRTRPAPTRPRHSTWATLTGPVALDQFINTTWIANTLLNLSDFYKFTLASSQAVRITAVPAVSQVGLGKSLGLSLEDSSGTGIVGANTQPPVVDATLDAGTYYVAVGNSDAVDTHYRLDIEFPPQSPVIGVLQGFTSVTSAQVSPVDFGNVLVATTDTHKAFTIRNDGSATLNLNTIVLSPMALNSIPMRRRRPRRWHRARPRFSRS